jgi:WD40 repeat protein
MTGQAAVLAPYRALGVVTDGNALSVNRRGAATFVTTSAGRAWQLYNAAKLTLVFVGPQVRRCSLPCALPPNALPPHPRSRSGTRVQLPKRIVALASKGEVTFAACGGSVHVCKRNYVEGVWHHVTTGRATVRLLETLGDLLLSVADDGSVCVWKHTLKDTNYDAPQTRWETGPAFTPSAMCHPPTYLNKVLLGSEQGTLQLWNLSSGTLVHEFACALSPPVHCITRWPRSSVSGARHAISPRRVISSTRTGVAQLVMEWYRLTARRLLSDGGGLGRRRGWGCAVRCLAHTPALDVVVVGLADGRALLYNLRRVSDPPSSLSALPLA